jgi:hypothetical protein
MQPGQGPGLLAWQQVRQSASQQRLAFSQPVLLLAWRQVLQPVWQRQVWLLVSLQLVWRQSLAWQQRQVSQQQVSQQQVSQQQVSQQQFSQQQFWQPA